MTMSIQKSQADQSALGSMSIRELLVELASLEDDRAELADAADASGAPDSGTAAALAADMSARERAIREELRQRRLALREHG